MSQTPNHPPNLIPYLDGSLADKEYQEVKRHVESCAQCKEEVRIWESLDGMFRSPELEIEVPPFQWQRIQSGLTASRPVANNWERFFALLRPRQNAWKAALAVMIIGIVSLSGWQYHRVDQRNQLRALADFSQSESQRLSEARNPFSAFGEAAIENPFNRFEAKISGVNPFAAR
jgi:anti-sigma factor RsiW